MKRSSEETRSNDSESLGGSLIDSVSRAGVVDMAAEAAEFALDGFLEEGVFRDLPIVGWMIKTYNALGAIRDRIFIKKVASFLAGTDAVSVSERDEFREMIQQDKSFAKKVGENLVLLLDRHEDFDKAFILGKVFARYMKGLIQYDQFLRIAKSIEIAYVGDLISLPDYYDKIKSYNPELHRPFSSILDDETSQSLYSSGLVRSEGYSEEIYFSNSIGEEIVKSLNE